MLIYSFKIKWLRVVSFIVLLVILTVGGYFFFNMENPGAENIEHKEVSEAWQV